VVGEVGENNIVRIVTDNCSNYKKVCRYLTNEYRHIAFERMTDVDTTIEALSEAQIFCAKASSFSSPLAQKIAVDDKTSSGMYIQLYLLASHVLTLKLMMYFHHLQVHDGKCLVTPHLHFISLQ
jgi:hypothetical protein